MENFQFKIFDASAGSGKTFTLVKEFLSIVLSSNNPQKIKQLLAITFTNKAVNEMKTRILKYLYSFSTDNFDFLNDDPMAVVICKEQLLDLKGLQKRAQKSLQFILHNYFFFDIVTIDKFNHRLIKAFAQDLKLPVNFETGIDTKLLLEEAVDNLIDKAGEDRLLTKVLVDFALNKTDEDKNWDIARDLKKTSELLMEENHYHHILKIKNTDLRSLNALNTLLIQFIKELSEKISANANDLIALFHENNLTSNDFSRGTLYNHFKKIADANFNKLFENKLESNISEGNIYNKSLSEEKKATIDSLLENISDTYFNTKKKIYQLKFLLNFQNNLTPLSLLNLINEELQKIKEDRNLLLVSEFNSLISEVIADQPAPFIYERIGEKYKHYFIDEFQDTSELQWKNLLPLIKNALQTETLDNKKGTLMIVGDAKQAIYRWRGGNAEQFIALCKGKQTFHVDQSVKHLEYNRRSYDEIVKFNNGFFKHISQYLNDENYKDLYKNHSFQKTTNKKGGYVNFNFIDNATEEDYCKVVQKKIHCLIENGFSFSDICVLTQKKKQGILIAEYLAENNIPIISSESLLLKNNTSVEFLVNLIKYSITPENKEIRFMLIVFLAKKIQGLSIHSCVTKYLNKPDALFKEFNFKIDAFNTLPFYNAVEYAISVFELEKQSSAYLMYFMDEIFNIITKRQSIQEFLDYWEQKKNSLSIVAPQKSNAVQIMTIHKAKGLEFPAVIYPFANTYLYDERDPKTWMPLDESVYGIPAALINKKKEMSLYNNYGKRHYEKWQSKLELDKFNVLYVALTRAVEKLYIISEKRQPKKEKPETFSELFMHFLKEKGVYNEQGNSFDFGSDNKKVLINPPQLGADQIPFVTNHTFNKTFKIITKSGSLWDTEQQKAIEKGNLYHYILSKIKYASDIETVIEEVVFEGIISETEKKSVKLLLERILFHPELKDFYTNVYTVYNEQAIFNTDQTISKPDRIVLSNKNEVTLIDYKTGSYSSKYEIQLKKYEKLLADMGFVVVNKILVFIGESIEIKQIH